MLYFTYREQYSYGKVVDMFIIHLVDIGGDGLVTDFTSTMDTLTEVEILVEGAINQHLGVHSTRLVYEDDLTYSVFVDGHKVGDVVIKDVNAAPIKRE